MSTISTLEHPMIDQGQTAPFGVEGIDPVFNNGLWLAHMGRVYHRQDHEPANVEKLSPTDEERQHYREMIGRPERVGELIAWLGTHATRAYEALESDEASKYLKDAPAKVVLETGGKLQEGRWAHTTELDAVARSIPGQLEVLDPRIGIKVYYGAREARTRYKIMPQLSGGGLRYAVLRRRLITADVNVPGCLPVELYKECTTVVDVAALAAITDNGAQQVDIKDAFRRNYEYAQKSNSRIAKRAGALLEAAIHGDLQLQEAILPVGSHHMMAVRQPEAMTV